MTDEEAILIHLDRQIDCPEGFVVLDNGEIRPVGGDSDNVSPQLFDEDYLPDPDL